jgi:hypothetical protein
MGHSIANLCSVLLSAGNQSSHCVVPAGTRRLSMHHLPLSEAQQTAPLHLPLKGRYTLSVKLSDIRVTSYLTEKLSKLRSFDRQQRWLQNCPFQSYFTQRTAQFTQGIPQFPQYTCRHHDGIISRHSTFQNEVNRGDPYVH